MNRSGSKVDSLRAFAVLPDGHPDPAGLKMIGRVDRFDLGVPIAARAGADILVLSERLVDAEEGWDAVRGIAARTGAEVWVVPDGEGRSRANWQHVATRVLGVAPPQHGPAVEGTATGKCDLVLVLGTKGGVGKTFVSANLAYAAATAGLSVSAVDLDVETGDLGLRLGLKPGIDLAGIGTGTLEAVPHTWATSKQALPITLLAAVPKPEFAYALDEPVTGLLLDHAALHGQCIIVDTPSDPDSPAVYAAMDRASSIVLVSTLNPGSVRQAKTIVDLLKRLNIPVRDRLFIVVNRYTRRAPVDAAAFRELVWQDPRVIINDIGVVADLEAYFGCPTIGGRHRRRVADPVHCLARQVIGRWPSSTRSYRRPGLRLLGRRGRMPSQYAATGRRWM